jgi:S-DNA-T family DNA segregation ATPase FtsK/SpoIIIE
VSNPLDLRVTRSLELLDDLVRTVGAYSKKEADTVRDLRTRRNSAQRKFQDAIEKAETRLSTQAADIEGVFKAETERVNSIYQFRREQIQRIHGAAIRQLPRRAQDEKRKWMGELQMRQFKAERKKASDLQDADMVFGEFTTALEERKTLHTSLERRARNDFDGYWTFLRRLRRERNAAPKLTAQPEDGPQLLNELEARLRAADEQLGAFHRFWLPRVFHFAPLLVLILLILLGAVVLAFALGGGPPAERAAGATAVALLVVVCGIHHAGWRQSRSTAIAGARFLAEAHRLLEACVAASVSRHQEERRKINEEYDQTCADIAEQWNRAGDIESEFEQAAREKIVAQTPGLYAKNKGLLTPRLERLAAERASRDEQLRNDAEARKHQATQTSEATAAALDAEEKALWETLETGWKREIIPIYEAINAMNSALAPAVPAWSAQCVESWTPPAGFTPATKFAHLEVDLTKQEEPPPADPRLTLPGPPQLAIPVALSYPDMGSLLFETFESAGPAVMGTINEIILRLLSCTPPGKLSFTIIDPVGLGQNFAGLMHLSDYEDSLINRRIWTQRDQIEERLAELSEHTEKVIQMYLRNEYATITEYNAQAGSVAEKYHFLVIADFPANFSETAAKRLQSIANSGARCGIFTLIHWDQRQHLPDGFAAEDLRKGSVCIRQEKNQFIVGSEQIEARASLVLEPPPDPDLELALVHKIGKSSIDSNRVQVPFLQIAPKPADLWANDTTSELKIAIGRTGATKLQYLSIGKGTRQHALFAGKTGSGKSTLFHVIITNLALACSPEQVEFYLVDFKKGVEFKCYASKRLPHARVVAIESDREFALSVLQRVDEELKRRGDMFRKLGVQDIAGYKRAGGKDPIPRSLLIIDEFQEFFVDDDAVAQTASLLFDRIVRQGRAFGIHVLLGSQTLGGAYSLARATLGQMVIRVALQCNEADSYLIMDDSNSAPRLLSRPGEGIYNDAAGALEGNSPFQVVWLPDDERDDWLDKVNALAEQHHEQRASPIIFEGNAPADIRENDLLRALLDAEPSAPALAGVGPAEALEERFTGDRPVRCWFGAPNSIKGPTEVVFHRQSGNHLLIVGQRDEAALTMLGLSVLALAAQYPIGGAKFVFLHSASPGTQDANWIERIVAAIPHEVAVVRGQDVAEAMNGIDAELKARISGEHPADSSPVFLFIHGLHRFKKLRHEDEFNFSMSGSDSGPNPGARFNDLICEGSAYGLHILTSVDSFNNVNRFMSRKALSEFEMRIVFQMGANDSASLIDSPKATTLGLHRALLYNEHEGSLETFRPYAAPDQEWIRQAAEKLSRIRV